MLIQSTLRSLVASALLFLLPYQAVAEKDFEIIRYGSFVHFFGMPEVLFFSMK